MDERTIQIVKRFSILPQLGKLEFLTRLAHDETVYIRVGLLSKPPQLDPIRGSNEFIHQICNYSFQVLGINSYLSDTDIIESLVENFEERGESGLEILNKALASLEISG